ncbi:hypothetical protein RND81_08G078500 [Saponaria officinalis]|uniref:F-box domain-containing protein n=1 Tax=Saponaria officinalis TaxID=3572 RepID=A0AAW1J4U2_SAPOF
MSQAGVAKERARKKKKSADLLSNLPEEVRLKVLERLPVKDAIKTSILSTNWRYNWAKLPRIIFDSKFLLTIDKESVEASDISGSYSNIVSNILLGHDGPIHKFVLCIPWWFKSGSNIYLWLRYVSRKRVGELTVIDEREQAEKLPSTVFLYAELTCLTLQWCKISTLPRTFTSFPHLTSLALIRCDFKSTSILERIINSSPQLRFLHLGAAEVINVTVHSPKLEHLIVEGLLGVLRLGDETINIKKMELDFDSNTHFSLVHSSLPVLQSLSFGSCCFMSNSHWRFGNNGIISAQINSRRRFGDQCIISDLEWVEIQALKLTDVPLYCDFISSFVLKLLYYDLCRCRLPRHMSGCKDFDLKDGALQGLKYVELVGVSGSCNELCVIEVILKCAPVLKVMTIELSGDVKTDDKEKLKIATKLVKFSRAARNVRIVFNT